MSTPAGMLIRSFLRTCLTPWPPQDPQGSEITWPVPPQLGHSATWVKLPKGVRVARRTCPAPPQVPQVVGPLPALAPLPPQVRRATRTPFGSFTQVAECPNCGGTGQVISDPCGSCGGQGVKQVRKKLRINIPAGVDTGTRLRVTGEGNAGPRGLSLIHISEPTRPY